MAAKRTQAERRFQITDTRRIAALDCSCGLTRRAFVDDPDQVASLHIVQVSSDAKTHYHKRTTEIYYVLEGNGQMELDGQLFDISPESAIMIKPECRHRAIGQMKILNVPIPAYDPDDEYFD